MAPPDHKQRFVIVPAGERRRAVAGVVVALWLLSLVAAWTWSARIAAPGLGALREGDAEQAAALQAARAELATMRQRIATLSRSDEISRRANTELQRTLADREEEVAQLRSDVAFYERLVGSSGQRRGLSVHSVRMAPSESGALWNYSVTLTQNLNRGSTTQGELRMQIEGIRDGRLVTLGWDDLVAEDSGAQPFAFRYFQQVDGSVLLPDDFAPQRVRVQLRADGRSTEQAFPWEATQTNTTRP